MKKVAAKQKTGIETNPGQASLQARPCGTPYVRDPDFKPRPVPKPLLGPGSELLAQEREVVRRLLGGKGIQKPAPPDLSVLSLPKGVRLNDKQAQLYLSLAGELSSTETKNSAALTLLDYRVKPVRIDQFVDDDYYLGFCLHRTDTNEGLWPWWRDWLVEHANQESFLHNLVISGAIGIGKTLLMVVLILYRIYICTTLRDPYSFFGLSRGSPIVFLLLSLSMDTLRATAWLTALRLMGSSPFFREVCCFDRTKVHAGLDLLLQVNAGTSDEVPITLSGGSKSQHQVGLNVLGVGLDESNFRLERDPYEYASELFMDLRARMVSRFQRIGGFMPGLSIVASSAAGESCFTEMLIGQIEKESDPLAQLVVRPALYRVKPGLKLCRWWFKVSYGLPNVDPAILHGCYADTGQPIAPTMDTPAEIAGSHETVPPGARFELVPGDFYDDFARSTRKGLQQLSGISLGGSNKLFSTLADIQRCLDLSAKDGVRIPSAATVISVSDENSRQIWEDLNHKTFVRATGSNTYEPVRHPHRLRYAHIDLAINGLAGVAICHLADLAPSSSEMGSPGNKPLGLVVEYDFILTLAGGRTRPICYDKIERFFDWLRRPCGFRFALVTADSFQSEQMLQTLYAKGIKTARQSVDRDKRAYLAWQGGFQEGGIRLYPQAQLLKEAAALIETEEKIERPPDGTKDTTDAAAGAYLNAIASEEVRTLTVPQAPPAVVGISLHANASPEDPFGFYIKLKRRPIMHFLA